MPCGPLLWSNRDHLNYFVASCIVLSHTPEHQRDTLIAEGSEPIQHMLFDVLTTLTMQDLKYPIYFSKVDIFERASRRIPTATMAEPTWTSKIKTFLKKALDFSLNMVKYKKSL